MLGVINTRIHGILDYLVAIFLIIAPWLFDLLNSGIATWLPMAMGGVILVISMITAYEVGAARVIPMKTHLIIDLFIGAFLAASPWIFGFDEQIYLPHVIVGGGIFLIAILTSGTPTATKDTPTTTH